METTFKSMMDFKRGKLSNKKLVELYQQLLKPRMIEEKMLILLRQGKDQQMVFRNWPGSDFRGS